MARVAKAASPVPVTEVMVRMSDRVSLLAPRMSMLQSSGTGTSLNLMEDVRVSVNMAYLLNKQKYLRQNALSIEPFLQHFSAYFFKKLVHDDVDGRVLLTHLDRLLYQACNLPSSAQKNEVISSLAGIRRDMFPQALFYRAAIGSRRVK
jgi:hypothetical protein